MEQKRRAPAPPKMFIIQNRLRGILEKIRPRSMKPVREKGTGVDFVFAKIKIDQKFSFGSLGENVIKIRVAERKLLNESQWTMCITKKGTAVFFPTRRLTNYVSREMGTIQKSLLIKKSKYSEHSVSLTDFFESEGVKPIECELTSKALIKALKEMNEKETGKKQQRSWFSMFFGPNRQLKLSSPTRSQIVRTNSNINRGPRKR